VIVDLADWHWIFLVNVPIGIAVFVLSLALIPGAFVRPESRRVDIAGAITVTAALMIAVYAVVKGNDAGWLGVQTLGLLALSVALFLTFLLIESRFPAPLVPLRLFKLRNLSTASVVGILWSAAMFALFFLSAQYLQYVLHYSPLQVGLSFLPANVIMAVFSVGLSARVVMRFGIKTPTVLGMSLIALGLLLFARAATDGNFAMDVLPGMIVVGFGIGLAFNPVLLAAMSDVEPSESGLASGVANTAFMMGGALGLAVLASVAASRTDSLEASGSSHVTALTGGYHLAFLVGAVFAAAAAGVAAKFLRVERAPAEAPAFEHA
jgi:MFS family permease